jgi:hypothetical protein
MPHVALMKAMRLSYKFQTRLKSEDNSTANVNTLKNEIQACLNSVWKKFRVPQNTEFRQ